MTTTQVVETVRRVRQAKEPAGAFCTEISIGSFRDSPVQEDSFKMMLNRPMETPHIVQQHIDGYPTKVFMPKTGQIDETFPLQTLLARGTGLCVQNALSDALEVVMGGVFIGTGTTVNDASATTTSCILTSAANFREGGGIGFASGSGGAMEYREIKTISSNTVTWKIALSNAPANSSVAYAGITHYLDNTDGNTVQAMQKVIEGLDDNDRWLFSGGQITSPFTLDLTHGAIGKVGFQWHFANWQYANASETAGSPATTMNQTSAAIADQSLVSTGINAIMDSEFLIHTHASTTRSVIDAQQIKITPQIKYGPHKTPGTNNNIKQWVRLRAAPAAIGEFVLPHYDTTWKDFRNNQTLRGIHFQIGSGVTSGGILVSVPSIQVDDWQREGMDGIAGQRVKWYSQLDNTTTTNSNNLQKSALRIHIF
jgi:hypothetical protein